MIKKEDTSWERSARWYHKLLDEEGTYQKELILPNLLRLMDIRRGDAVLDLACGQGFFAREFAKLGARVMGVDASKTLISFAEREAPAGAKFHVARANALPFLGNGSVDKVTIVLALQNIDEAGDTLRECARVLKKNGTLYIVLNHPAFRIPKASSWGWDEERRMKIGRAHV